LIGVRSAGKLPGVKTAAEAPNTPEGFFVTEGLRCPQCACPLSRVIWSRQHADVRARLRVCCECGTRFHTTEQIRREN